ncbi:hypothetical protein WMO79_01140 [Micrococcaceae bacterium Sec7.4]
MNSSDITSEAHINAAREAIKNLVSEYETLDARTTIPAQGRRTTAMERLCAVSFSTVTDDLDPYNMDDLDEGLAQGTLEWSLFVTDLMVTAMLDFREKAAEHHHRPEDYRDRLRAMLLDIWLMALEELKKTGDTDEEPGERSDDAGDAGEWGSLAA